MTPFMQIVQEVFESARDAGNEDTLISCRRLVRASRSGKLRSPEFAADKAHVWFIYEEICCP